MKVGDLVKITNGHSEDTRKIGTILKFDVYHGRNEYLHHDSPYNSPKVNTIIDDARSHIRTTKKKYDLTKSIFLEKSQHKLKTYLSLDLLKCIFNCM